MSTTKHRWSQPLEATSAHCGGLPPRLMVLLRPLCLLLALVVPAAVGPDDGLMPYPFMGWNAWAVFNTQQKTSEAVIRESADALVQSGLLEAGYDSLGWGEPGFVRDSAGQLGPRFPERTS